jgi:hypothetical protein
MKLEKQNGNTESARRGAPASRRCLCDSSPSFTGRRLPGLCPGGIMGMVLGGASEGLVWGSAHLGRGAAASIPNRARPCSHQHGKSGGHKTYAALAPV